MKKSKILIETCLMLSLLFIANVVSADKSAAMTKLIYAELDQVDHRNKTVVVQGKQYTYNLDLDVSMYRSQEDVKTSLTLKKLKQGEQYYFQIVARGENYKSGKYNEIVFIAKLPPRSI